MLWRQDRLLAMWAAQATEKKARLANSHHIYIMASINSMDGQNGHIDPKQPKLEDRDRFVLSKGHTAPVLYSTFEERGYIRTIDEYGKIAIFERKNDDGELTDISNIVQSVFGILEPQVEEIQENENLRTLKITEVEPNREQPRKG